MKIRIDTTDVVVVWHAPAPTVFHYQVDVNWDGNTWDFEARLLGVNGGMKEPSKVPKKELEKIAYAAIKEAEKRVVHVHSDDMQ